MSRQGGHGWGHHIVTVVWVVGWAVVSKVFWFVVALAGYLVWQEAASPTNLLVGLPLMLLGWGFILSSIWDELLAVFSDKFNHSTCIVCRLENKTL